MHATFVGSTPTEVDYVSTVVEKRQVSLLQIERNIIIKYMYKLSCYIF